MSYLPTIAHVRLAIHHLESAAALRDDDAAHPGEIDAAKAAKRKAESLLLAMQERMAREQMVTDDAEDRSGEGDG